MDDLRNQIEIIIRSYTIQEHITDVIDGDDIGKISIDLVDFIQAVFDPENQPNQYGIKLF